MKLWHLLVLLGACCVALGAFTMATSAQSFTPVAAPPTLVVEVNETGTGFGDRWQADGPINFRFSPDDPDQTNGAFNYSLGIAVGSDPGSAINTSYTPIAGRTGWASFDGGIALDGTGNSSTTFWVIAWDGADGSADSCTVTLDLRETGHGQCGSQLDPPAGTSAIVITASDPPDETNVTLRVALSPDDPDQTNGTLTYTLFTHNLKDDVEFNDGDVTSLESDGVRRVNFTFFDGSGADAVGRWGFRFRADDPLTLERSEPGCQVAIDAQVLFSTDRCGLIASPGAGIVAQGPQYPLLNVTQISDASGIDLDVLALILAGVTMFSLGILGIRFAGIMGALVGGGLGMVFGYYLALLPVWIIVLAFLGCAAIIVFSFAGGDS